MCVCVWREGWVINALLCFNMCWLPAPYLPAAQKVSSALTLHTPPHICYAPERIALLNMCCMFFLFNIVDSHSFVAKNILQDKNEETRKEDSLGLGRVTEWVKA